MSTLPQTSKSLVYYPSLLFSSGPHINPTQVARVQKIIHADPERLNVTKNAAFAIALATEMFIQHLATTTHNVVKAERKPRRNIQYRDVSSAIAKTDNLEFAVDVVPKTMIWKEARKRKEEREEREKMAEEGKAKGKEVVNGSRNGNYAEGRAEENTVETNGHAQGEPTTNGNDASVSASPIHAAKPEVTSDAMEVDERVQDSEPEEDAAAMQLEMEMRGPPGLRTASPDAKPTPVPAPMVTTRRSAGGFTSINGAR
jgi:DNA polymerase epsilon subunit 4